MKKLLIAALICAPMAMMAQTTKPAVPSGKEGDKEQPKTQPNKTVETHYIPETIYGDLVISTNNTGGASKTTIRLDFGRELMNLITDKELIVQLNALRTMNFATIPDAMSFMNADGWKLTTTYNLTGAQGPETHLLLEKRIGKRPPMEPTTGPQKPPSMPKDPAGRPDPMIKPQGEKGKG